MTTPIPETPPHGSTWLEAVGILRANALACPHCADDKARPDPCTCTCHSDYVRAVTPIDAPDAAELATLGRQNAERELVRVGEALEHERAARQAAESEAERSQAALAMAAKALDGALAAIAIYKRTTGGDS